MATTRGILGRYHEVHRLPELRASLQTDSRISDGHRVKAFATTALTMVEEHGDRFVWRMCTVIARIEPARRVPGRCTQEERCWACYLCVRERMHRVAATVWWRVHSACRVTSGRSWCPT